MQMNDNRTLNSKERQILLANENKCRCTKARGSADKITEKRKIVGKCGEDSEGRSSVVGLVSVP